LSLRLLCSKQQKTLSDPSKPKGFFTIDETHEWGHRTKRFTITGELETYYLQVEILLALPKMLPLSTLVPQQNA
jgi:hypothetical protein